MKVLRIIPLVLIVLTWACTETAYDERQVLTKEELQIAMERSASFTQYIDILVAHEAQISSKINALEEKQYETLYQGTQQYTSFEQFSEQAEPQLVTLYAGIVELQEEPSLHLATLVTELDAEFVYDRKDLFEIIGQRLTAIAESAPKARLLDECEDVYWSVYTSRLNDNYYRLGMSLKQADANAVRDASWAKVGCRMSR